MLQLLRRLKGKMWESLQTFGELVSWHSFCKYTQTMLYECSKKMATRKSVCFTTFVITTLLPTYLLLPIHTERFH